MKPNFGLPTFKEVYEIAETKAAVTDHAILTGTCIHYLDEDEDNSLKGRAGWYWQKLEMERNYLFAPRAHAVDGEGFGREVDVVDCSNGTRPALSYSFYKDTYPYEVEGTNEKGVPILEYGYYPDYAPGAKIQNILTDKLHKGLLKRKAMTFTTGIIEVADLRLRNNSSKPLLITTYEPIVSDVYEYDGKLYIRIESRSYKEKAKLSNGETYKEGDLVWEEVSKVRFLNNEKAKKLIPEKILFGGIPLNYSYEYNDLCDNFKESFMYKYLNEYFAKDIMQTPKDLICKYNIIFEDNILVIEYFNLEDLDFNYIKRLLISNSNINTICLKCPKFSLHKRKEKKAFNMIFRNKMLREKDYYINYNKKENISIIEDYEEKIILSDIEELKKEIKDMCNTFPNDISKVFLDSLDEIDKYYNDTIKKYKPEYGKENNTTTDYISLENNVYSLLLKIKVKISSTKDIIDFKNDINKYKELLNNKYKKVSNEKNIEGYIKDLLYISCYLYDTKKGEIKRKISSYLDFAINKANDILNSILCDEIHKEDTFFIKQELENSLITLLKETKELIKDTPKYKLQRLYNVLNNNELEINDSDDDIISDINKIKGVLNGLTGSRYKNIIRKEFNNILDKHKEIISKYLDGDITIKIYKEIVLNIRRNIHLLLEKINRYTKLDEYEKLGINIYRQLDISFDLVNDKSILDEELRNYNNKDVLFEVINILKKVEEKELEEDICTEVYKDLNNILTSIKSTLEITDISAKDKYTNFIVESCVLFNKVSSDIDRYIIEMERYKDFFSSSHIVKGRK